jgi:hypothetical protein
MCACQDKACASGVVAEMAAWSKSLPPDVKYDADLSREIMKRYNACMKRAQK